MRKEAQTIEIIRQAAILTANYYGPDEPLGEHLMGLLYDAADGIGSHFEVMYALKSLNQTLEEINSGKVIGVPERAVTKADARLARDVISRLCREMLDPEIILNLIETADYIDCCVRMSEERAPTPIPTA